MVFILRLAILRRIISIRAFATCDVECVFFKNAGTEEDKLRLTRATDARQGSYLIATAVSANSSAGLTRPLLSCANLTSSAHHLSRHYRAASSHFTTSRARRA